MQTPNHGLDADRRARLATGIERTLDAMAANYAGGHRWDRLDGEAVTIAADEIRRLRALLNTPEVSNFVKGVMIEAPHQIERWGADHDAGKDPLDWVWLLGHLVNKAARAALDGDTAKAKHHTISSAAALANWHAQLSGRRGGVRPGIDAAARGLEA